MERVVGAVGVDEAWRLRGGVPSRLPWPLPPSLRADAAASQPAATAAGSRADAPPRRSAPRPPMPGWNRRGRPTANGHAEEGDRQLGLALRLDPRIAPEGVSLMEP